MEVRIILYLFTLYKVLPQVVNLHGDDSESILWIAPGIIHWSAGLLIVHDLPAAAPLRNAKALCRDSAFSTGSKCKPLPLITTEKIQCYSPMMAPMQATPWKGGTANEAARMACLFFSVLQLDVWVYIWKALNCKWRNHILAARNLVVCSFQSCRVPSKRMVILPFRECLWIKCSMIVVI